MPDGLARHAALAGLLIAAGELAQGMLDARLAADGAERPSRLAEALGGLTLALAAALRSSFARWSAGRSVGRSVGCAVGCAGGCSGDDDAGAVRAELRRARRALDRLAGPAGPALPHEIETEVEIKVPEGYSIYALYPEAYLAAGARLAGESAGPLTVIGIRSIGSSLGAAVATATGANRLVTVRPVGHPFARHLDLSPALARRLAASEGRRYAVVDEGPGLSGSSFGAVADWLEDRGVAPPAITFLPGHAGDLGPRSSGRHRARWARARRLTASFEELFLELPADSPRHLARWAADRIGRAVAPPQDLSGGRWRWRIFPGEACWPPADPQQERRKWLVRTERGAFLLKFVGLGRYGDEAYERARILAAAGFGPPVAALRHGFLVGPWLEGARPLAVADVDRRALVEHLARYLAFVARRFPAPAGTSGASPARLFEMAHHNAAAALGDETAEGLRAFAPLVPALGRRARPVLGDHKLQSWEWLVRPDGRIVKTDGLDHWRGHDLVGAQDAAWDLAGAIEELELDAGEIELLRRRLGEGDAAPVAAPVLAFYRAVYLAFQLGRQTLARDSAMAYDAAEAARLERAAERYRARLRTCLRAARPPIG